MVSTGRAPAFLRAVLVVCLAIVAVGGLDAATAAVGAQTTRTDNVNDVRMTLVSQTPYVGA